MRERLCWVFLGAAGIIGALSFLFFITVAAKKYVTAKTRPQNQAAKRNIWPQKYGQKNMAA